MGLKTWLNRRTGRFCAEKKEFASTIGPAKSSKQAKDHPWRRFRVGNAKAYIRIGAGDGGTGLAKPSGARDLHSGEGEDGKCGHGVADTGFAFQSPGRPRAPIVTSVEVQPLRNEIR